jgi:hypothetical protein
VNNNPLSFTDPSGFFLSGLFHKIGNFFRSVAHAIGRVFRSSIFRAVAQILACATPGLNAIVCPAVIVGLTFAAGGSFGESLKSIAFTFATMGIFSGVGTALQGAGLLTRVLVHGVVGGALSVAQGGSFSAGFLSNAAGAGISGLTGGIGGSDFGSVVVRTAIAAAAGGTASVLAGGKFANGAISAAFAHLYNAEDRLGTHSDPIQTKLQSLADKTIADFDALGDAGFSRAQLDAINQNGNLRETYRGFNIDRAIRDGLADDPELSRLTGFINRGVDLTDPDTGLRYEMTTSRQWPSKIIKYGTSNLFHINTSRILSRTVNSLGAIGAVLDIVTGRSVESFCQANSSICYSNTRKNY